MNKLEEVSLPNSITYIGQYGFSNCTSLSEITIPEGMTSISTYVFQNCSRLTSATIPDSVTRIDEYAFNNRDLKIYFRGTEAQWNGSIGDNNIIFESIFFNYFSVDASFELSGTSFFYTGKEIRPIVTVTYNGDLLVEGTDYELLYDNNINAGTASVIITGKGNYTGTFPAAEFTINPASIDTAEVSGIQNKTYNGSAQTQTPVVKVGSTTLTEGTDYTISYRNNVNAGIATVNITGLGHYIGEISKTFTIAKAAQNLNVVADSPIILIGKTTNVSASGAKETSEYTFSSSDPAVATVDSSGTVIGKGSGTVTITVKAAATVNYNAASKTVKITVTAPKTLKKPGNCHFVKWNNAKYTGCRIGWNKVEGAEGYQTLLSWTDGSHSSAIIVKSNVLYRDCTVHPQHVSQMKVRAFYTLNGQRKYGPGSNVEYITPSPAKLNTKNTSSGSNLNMNISWNIIYGCNGYNVFITTNPNGKWYWNQSTTEKATATSTTIDKCGGAKLKKNTRYYVRIVTRRKRNGVFCTVPMPANNTYIGSFVIN